MRTRAERRHNDVKKAVRKRKLAEEITKVGYYDNLHQYSKNKIHCSCPICQEKTNAKHNNGAGTRYAPEEIRWKFSYGTTNHRHKKNWKPSDLRKLS